MKYSGKQLKEETSILAHDFRGFIQGNSVPLLWALLMQGITVESRQMGEEMLPSRWQEAEKAWGGGKREEAGDKLRLPRAHPCYYRFHLGSISQSFYHHPTMPLTYLSICELIH